MYWIIFVCFKDLISTFLLVLFCYNKSFDDHIILSIIPDCAIFPFEFVNIWSDNVEVFSVILVAPLII